MTGNGEELGRKVDKPLPWWVVRAEAAWTMALGSLTVIYPNPNLGTLSATLKQVIKI